MSRNSQRSKPNIGEKERRQDTLGEVIGRGQESTAVRPWQQQDRINGLRARPPFTAAADIDSKQRFCSTSSITKAS